MSALLAGGDLVTVTGEAARQTLASLRGDLVADRLIPYLGPGLLALGAPAVPTSPEAVAVALQKKVPVPGRIRGNMWSVAQYIESHRHRRTLGKLMAGIFAAEPAPTAFHRFLAGLPLSLVVDSWYDGTLAAAYGASGRTDVADIQGMSRAGIGEDRWYRAWRSDGTPHPDPASARTVLYTPHGGIRPAGDVLVSDSDYVEVLTEIDIQTPIPDIVQERRQARGFLCLGCRFDDQMLRTYARQIKKRSTGPHHAVADAAALTGNELRFLAAEEITLIDLPLADAIAMLSD
jgi:hypothetical protein